MPPRRKTDVLIPFRSGLSSDSGRVSPPTPPLSLNPLQIGSQFGRDTRRMLRDERES